MFEQDRFQIIPLHPLQNGDRFALPCKADRLVLRFLDE